MKKRLLAIIMSAIMVITFATVMADAKDYSPEKHTREEIEKCVLEAEQYFNAETTYTEKPSAKKPYKTGALSQKTLNAALEVMNMYRYIAGLNAVKLDDEYNKYAQAGAVLDEAVGFLSHTPGKPSDMSDSFYKMAYEGTSSSNLYSGGTSWGYTLADGMVGWMSDNNNLMPGVGHRDWMLDPNMKKVGFGITENYRAMYVFDSVNSGLAWDSDKKYKNIIWPAAETPLDYFDNAIYWSIRTGDNETASKISITVTDKTTKESYKVSKSDISIDSGYAGADVVVFRSPISDPKDGRTYTVKMTGLTQGALSYNVHFFNIDRNSDLAKSVYPTLAWTSATYNGKTKAPAVTVKDIKGNVLKKDVDYAVEYAQGRKNVGAYKVTVKGIGNYTGTKTLTFKIKAAGIESAKLSYTSTTYDGKTKKPSVTVIDKNGNILVNDTDYTVKYGSGRKKVGTYKVTITGTGNYSFTEELTFKIKAAGIDTAKLSYTAYKYTGKAKTPVVTVVDKNGNTLTKDKDYTVKYASGRKEIGTYKVTVKGKGNYSFTKTLSFKINPQKPTLSSVTKKSKTSITVKWKKVSNTTGYQIKYVKADGTYKTLKVKGASTVSKVLTELKKGETYKVSIRTYKTVSGTTYYSAYSTAKSVSLK